MDTTHAEKQAEQALRQLRHRVLPLVCAIGTTTQIQQERQAYWKALKGFAAAIDAMSRDELADAASLLHETIFEAHR